MAAAGGDRSRASTGPGDDAFASRDEPRHVGRIALLNDVVVHVVVVDNLDLEAELDRLPEPALCDRAGITVVLERLALSTVDRDTRPGHPTRPW